MLHICRGVECREDGDSESDISEHEGEPGKGRSVSNVGHCCIFNPHLYELFPNLELYFGKGADEVACCVNEDVFGAEIPSLNTLHKLAALWLIAT